MTGFSVSAVSPGVSAYVQLMSEISARETPAVQLTDRLRGLGQIWVTEYTNRHNGIRGDFRCAGFVVFCCQAHDPKSCAGSTVEWDAVR